MSHSSAVAPAERTGPDLGGEAAYRYHLLRAASERFGLAPAALSTAQLAEASRQAERTMELEGLVLGSAEAGRSPVPGSRVEAALAELRSRYPDPQGFDSDLADNGLTIETLNLALERELRFDAVMQRVGERGAAVDEIELRLFYELHRERFTAPERRTARHLLITVNDAFPENRREAALLRIERLAEKLTGRPAARVPRFAALARKHSECPTAMEDGRLGEVVRGQLYPELDACLFRLVEGEVGGPVETEMGFHLIYCERIQRARTQPFAKVRGSIHDMLAERRRRNCQKAWLAELRQGGGAGAATQEAQ
jgi:peptidyl-prolyl cis-trans isomerase C